MAEKVQIDTNGIKKVLKSYKPEQAIAEYIWNGFDAGANVVEVLFDEMGGLGALATISVADNGSGISHKLLSSKFKPFLNSEKQLENPYDNHRSITHGKNGFGRLTFFQFSNSATWNTRFKDESGKVKEYNISIASEKLENYQVIGEVSDSSKEETGTSVTFSSIKDINKDFILITLTEYLRVEFGWFLELHKPLGFQIKIAGEILTYEEIVGERDAFKVEYSKTNAKFDLSFVRWNRPLKNEYSRYYLIDQYGEEKWKSTTRLNNKGDEFYHSVYVKSSYFDTFAYDPIQPEGQTTLIGHSKSDEAFRFLEEEITKYLRSKRRPFLEVYVDQKIDAFKKDGVIPLPRSEYDAPKNAELIDVIKGLYVIQPRIFTNATDEQKKIFVRLLDALLDTSEREAILRVVDEVLGLDEDEKKELLDLLKVTTLSGIVRVSKLIEERSVLISNLKKIVFDKALKANERDHLQKLLDKHFWVFGEEYALVTSTEAKFEGALRKHHYLLTGEDKEVILNHPDKNKEMDLFLTRQNVHTDLIDNLIVEIKSPSVHLGSKELEQLKKYRSVLLSQPECNAPNMRWDFILVGTQFDTSGYIDAEMENARTHGEKHKGLVQSSGNYKIYVKTWAQVFADFECRHKFLLDRLQLERDALGRECQDLGSIMNDSLANGAGVSEKVSLSR